jgi:hypothetical protein
MSTRILFISANSPAHSHVDIEDEQHGIQASIRAAKHREHFVATFAPAIRAEELPTYLSNETPTVVHFAGHGLKEGVTFRDSDVPISGAQLAEAFRDRDIRLVVLNSCFSMDQAKAIKKVVPSVIGTKWAVKDRDAVTFPTTLYRGLGDGLKIGDAFRDARLSVGLKGGDDAFKTLGDMNHVFAIQQDVATSHQGVGAWLRRFKFTMSFTVTIAMSLAAAVVVWRVNDRPEPPLIGPTAHTDPVAPPAVVVPDPAPAAPSVAATPPAGAVKPPPKPVPLPTESVHQPTGDTIRPIKKGFGPGTPVPRAEPSIVQPQSFAGLGGQQTFQCQLPQSSREPAAVHVWAVPYRDAAHKEWSNGPAYSPQLTQSANDPFAWTGPVDIDAVTRMPAHNFGFGYFFLCHASFAGDAVIDAVRSGEITNAAKQAGRTIDR